MDKQWLLVGCIIGCAVSSVITIQMIPPLFEDGANQDGLWVAVVFGTAAVMFGVLGKHLRVEFDRTTHQDN